MKTGFDKLGWFTSILLHTRTTGKFNARFDKADLTEEDQLLMKQNIM